MLAENQTQVEELLLHFPTNVPEVVINAVENKVLVGSRYLFIGAGKNPEVYCTHCHHYFFVEGPVKQNSKGECPSCGSSCTYKQSWRGRGKLVDDAYVLHFQKSILNPKIVTAEWVYVSIDYRGYYEDVPTNYTPIARYIFDFENKLNMKLEWWYWSKCWKAVNGFSTPTTISNSLIHTFIMHETKEKAIAETPFQYCGWESYQTETLLQYLPLASKYPSAEILTKAGLEEVVKEKLFNGRTYSAVNWNETKLHRIFKMSKQDFHLFVEKNPYRMIDLFSVWMWQQARKEKSQMDIRQLIEDAYTLRINEHLGTFKFLKAYTTIHRLINYVMRQFNQDTKHYIRHEQVLITWRDYLNDCKKIQMDLASDAVIFPKNLRKAHDETMKKVKHYEDELLKQKAMKRYKQIRKYEFATDQFVIIAPQTAKEIIDEGSKLDHCVGGYANRHADGETCILFLRRTEKQKESFYTLEVKGDRVVQVRGFKNKSATNEIQAFVDAFVAEKLKKKKPNKSKVKVVV